MARKEKFPDTQPAIGVPYEGIENIRPETQRAVEAFLAKQGSSMQ
ncbi:MULTISPECIES: hypothetical protein [unclassified Ruegeria]|nr:MULTISPECIES: hypothetical protein [unclassified Ruegeria]